MNLASMFKDIAITLVSDAGTPGMVHLSKDEGCIHLLIEDWDKLHQAVRDLIDSGEPKDAAPQPVAATETSGSDKAEVTNG